MGMSMTPSGSMSMSNDSMKPSREMLMHMNFYLGKDVIVFFSGWPGTSSVMYVLALLLVLLLGTAIEFLSLSLLPPLGPDTKPIVGAFTQACVYAVRMCFAYMLMLSVMSYNLGIFIAAVAGHTIGFFIVKYLALSKEAHHHHQQHHQYMSANTNSNSTKS